MSGQVGASGRPPEGTSFAREDKIREDLQEYILASCRLCGHEPSVREVAKQIGINYDTLYRFVVRRQYTMHPKTVELVEGWLRERLDAMKVGNGAGAGGGKK